MTVQGEEHLLVDISRGLFITPAPDTIPEGGCMQIQNMFKNNRGGWEIRKGIADITTTALSAITLGTKQPDYYAMPEHLYPNAVGFDAIVGAVRAPQFMYNYAITVNSKMVSNVGVLGAADITDFNLQNQGDSTAWQTACQYKDRYYFCALGAVYRLSGFIYDGTSPALTNTAVSGAIASGFTNIYDKPVIVAYQDRIFHALGNRISWTDIPTSGGYPEVWTAANFLELPTSHAGSPSVKNMFHLNGLLYIFTTKGIYALNGRGSSATWRIDFISDTIKIVNKQAVCLSNGVFICTDYRKLYLFNGTNITTIGDQVQYLFDIYNCFSVMPFEDGIILSCRYFTTSGGFWTTTTPPGGSTDIWPINRTFYFDGSVWTEIVTNVIGNSVDFLFGAVGKIKWQGKRQNVSFLIYYDPVLTSYGMCYYNRNTFQDTLSATTYSIAALLRSRYISSGVLSTYMKIKKWYVKAFSLLTGFVAKTFVDGAFANITSTSVSTTNQADNNYLGQAVGPEMCTRISAQITATSSGSNYNTDLPDSVPCFEIKQILLAGNTNIRDSTEGTET